ncbi:MAG: dTMP kinase [Candidatus Nanopelagicales bacterium]
MTGAFIAIEGGDGAGKSTQAKLLANGLRTRGHEVIITREPGGSPIAEKIRHVVLDVANLGLNERAEALLFAASRAEHVASTIRPALERGTIVISDRYMDSSIAYQGIARGLGLEHIRDLNLWATNNLVPDLTIILDVDAEHGLNRVADPNRIEEESTEFHSVVRDAFLELAKLDPDRYLIVSANQPAEEIAETIFKRVLSLGI